MKKLVSRGVVFLAGAVSLPVSMPQRLPGHAFVGYRQDPRLNILRRFFAEIGCPALRYAPAFVEAADDFALDWRLLPSLSYGESRGGKAPRNKNFFGWTPERAKFSSPAPGIQTVPSRLSHGERYHENTLD